MTKLERLFDVSNENPVPQDIAFSPDLTKVFMLGSTFPASIFEYDLGLSTEGNYVHQGNIGFTGSCTNTIYSGGIAVSYND